MKIYIDGDGCPVKKLVVEEAAYYDLPVRIVTTFDHFTQTTFEGQVEFIYVDGGIDAADYRIMSLVAPNDFLITQDYGLASLALAKGVRVFHQLGFQYTAESIDRLLASRHISGQLRRQGKRTSGPKKFTASDEAHFRQFFRMSLQKYLGKKE